MEEEEKLEKLEKLEEKAIVRSALDGSDKHYTDHLCQYRQDSKPQQGFAEQGQFPGEGSWLALRPTALSWFYTSG